jgi:TRAP-type C4-dicarboxylate transport system substrate-binding protein
MSASVRLRFGGYQAPESVHNRAARAFGDALRERLGASLEFEQIHSVLELGRGSADLPRMVSDGELDACYLSTVHYSQAVPELAAFELPFLIRDRDAAREALCGAAGARIGETFVAATGLRLLGLWDNGFRHFTNRVRPIRTPADCRGLRIRSQVSAMHAETFRALGFEPIPVDIKVYAAEVAGERFQAQENPLTNTWHFGVHEHHRWITLSSHFFGAMAMFCNAAVYDRWPAEVRAAVDAAAAEATRAQWRMAAGEDDAVLARIDPARNELIRLTEAERAQFIEAVRPVYEKYAGGIDAALLARLSA